jgi:hypothetical protein
VESNEPTERPHNTGVMVGYHTVWLVIIIYILLLWQNFWILYKVNFPASRSCAPGVVWKRGSVRMTCPGSRLHNSRSPEEGPTGSPIFYCSELRPIAPPPTLKKINRTNAKNDWIAFL